MIWRHPSLTRNRRGTFAAIFVTLGYVPLVLADWLWFRPTTACVPHWFLPALLAVMVGWGWWFALFQEPRPPARARTIWLMLGAAFVAAIIIGQFPLCRT